MKMEIKTSVGSFEKIVFEDHDAGSIKVSVVDRKETVTFICCVSSDDLKRLGRSL